MKSTKTYQQFGDFQTPPQLASEVCHLLCEMALRPASLVEPTCGRGQFLVAGLDAFANIQDVLGVEINADYVSQARESLQNRDAARINLIEADFFSTNWKQVVDDLPEPILVLGNPPWVTNAHQGSVGGKNLPHKSNHQKHNGLEAVTGKANFDISEWMLLRLLKSLNGKIATMAVLCKSSVARKVLRQGWKDDVAIEAAFTFKIDATHHFNAAVDAVLLVIHLGQKLGLRQAEIHRTLKLSDTPEILGYEGGKLIANSTAYHQWKFLCGEEVIRWRSGIKHDCAKVMELRQRGQAYYNGFGELVDIEDDYLYPMLKSSEVANDKCGQRYMIVPQKKIGDDTFQLQHMAPKTWNYLLSHAELLNRRASSIYKKQPPFSVFGVGEYTFAPWKVAISGFYKKLSFSVISPASGKPVVLDDTLYFLPCKTERQAGLLASLLNSEVARSFFESFIFWDNKRPITAELLRRLDVRKLAKEEGKENEFTECFK